MTANVVTPKLLEEALTATEERINTRFVTFEERIDKRFVTFEERIDKRFVTFEERIDERFERIDERFERIDERFETLFLELNRTMAQLRIDIHSDTLRSIQSVEESYRTRTAAIDDKYRDLPERVTTLEQAVGIKRP